MSRFYRPVKRTIDVVASVIGLLIVWPLLAIIAVLVWWRIGRPILFRQDRPGKNARIFRIYKFTTMTGVRDANGQLLPDEERTSRFGQWLRRTSLDELPQLFNVLRGDLSLVGPRPLLVDYLRYYTKEQARRHIVTPGITGWAQVNGRNDVSWDQRLAHDLWYVDHASLALDLKILWLTLLTVIRSEGVTPRDREFMPPFRGTGSSA